MFFFIIFLLSGVLQHFNLLCLTQQIRCFHCQGGKYTVCYQSNYLQSLAPILVYILYHREKKTENSARSSFFTCIHVYTQIGRWKQTNYLITSLLNQWYSLIPWSAYVSIQTTTTFRNINLYLSLPLHPYSFLKYKFISFMSLDNGRYTFKRGRGQK